MIVTQYMKCFSKIFCIEWKVYKYIILQQNAYIKGTGHFETLGAIDTSRVDTSRIEAS